MNEEQHDKLGLVRVEKRQARKIFDKWLDVYIQPTNVNSESEKYPLLKINRTLDSDFEKTVKDYELENCKSYATGRKTKFFVSDEKLTDGELIPL